LYETGRLSIEQNKKNRATEDSAAHTKHFLLFLIPILYEIPETISSFETPKHHQKKKAELRFPSVLLFSFRPCINDVVVAHKHHQIDERAGDYYRNHNPEYDETPPDCNCVEDDKRRFQ
jgi:hypothetical protein